MRNIRICQNVMRLLIMGRKPLVFTYDKNAGQDIRNNKIAL